MFHFKYAIACKLPKEYIKICIAFLLRNMCFSNHICRFLTYGATVCSDFLQLNSKVRTKKNSIS